MYSLEQLINENLLVDAYYIGQRDVDHVNKLINLIKSTRSIERPIIGDILQYTNNYGDYFPSAFFNNETDKCGGVCLSGGYPFVFENESTTTGISFSTSGGPWVNPPIERFKYIGRREMRFRFFRTVMEPTNGSLDFRATVNVWKFCEPNQRYGSYTTEAWSKSHFFVKEFSPDGNPKKIYQGSAECPWDEYTAWLEAFCAKEYTQDAGQNRVVFHYREVDHLLSYEMWDDLPLEYDTRRINGSVMLVKVKIDHHAHTVHTFRFTNGAVFSQERLLPFEKARRRINLDKLWGDSHREILRGAITSAKTYGYSAGVEEIMAWALNNKNKGVAVNDSLALRILREWKSEQDFNKMFIENITNETDNPGGNQ